MDPLLRPVDQYFRRLPEPAASCMLALRAFLLVFDKNLTEAWKYGMPFYCYKGKMCCYLWTRKDSHQPYLGIVNGTLLHHPQLLQEDRRRMKILLIDAEQDLPLELLTTILRDAIALH